MSESIINKKMILTKTIPFAVAGFVAFLIYILFFVNVNEMIRALGYTNLPVFLLATAASFLEMVFFALTWQYFLKPLSVNLSFKKLFTYSYVSNFIDLIIPAESVSGEITRIILVTSDGVETGKAAASVIVQRLLGLCIVGGTVAVGVPLMFRMQIPFNDIVQDIAYLVIGVTSIFIFIILLIFTNQRWVIKIVEKLSGFADWISRGRLKTESFKEKTAQSVTVFYQSIQAFRASPSRIVPPVVFCLISWFFVILTNYLAFASVGYEINWIVVMVGYALIAWLKAIPVGIPAEIGVTEIAMTAVFGTFGVPLSISAASVVLTRIITLLFRLCIGFVAFQRVGIKAMFEAANKLFIKK